MLKIIALKFPGRCHRCGDVAQRGERAYWSPGVVIHARCGPAASTRGPGGVELADDGTAAARGVAEITFDADPDGYDAQALDALRDGFAAGAFSSWQERQKLTRSELLRRAHRRDLIERSRR